MISEAQLEGTRTSGAVLVQAQLSHRHVMLLPHRDERSDSVSYQAPGVVVIERPYRSVVRAIISPLGTRKGPDESQ
jgi:hypothetical protein